MTASEASRHRKVILHHSAGAVVMIAGRCLVIRRRDRPEWVFPKGHLESGECAEAAAVREVREETGLDVEIVATLGTSRYAFGPFGQHREVVDWFLAEGVGGELALESIFGDAVLLHRRAAETILTHEADREIARKAFTTSEERGR